MTIPKKLLLLLLLFTIRKINLFWILNKYIYILIHKLNIKKITVFVVVIEAIPSNQGWFNTQMILIKRNQDKLPPYSISTPTLKIKPFIVIDTIFFYLYSVLSSFVSRIHKKIWQKQEKVFLLTLCQLYLFKSFIKSWGLIYRNPSSSKAQISRQYLLRVELILLDSMPYLTILDNIKGSNKTNY